MKPLGTIEFFTFESEVWYRATDGTQRRITEGDPIVRELLAHLSEFYPDALAALEEHYKRLSGNIVHYRFRIVQRFAKCNLGNIDHVADVCAAGRLHLEHVACPLRGECSLEGVCCSPKFNSKISPAEMRVLELLCDGLSRPEIADKLCLAELTVDNHIRNMRTRLGLRKESELVAYAIKNQLIKE